jgi:smad nuclear-interacting protein 1
MEDKSDRRRYRSRSRSENSGEERHQRRQTRERDNRRGTGERASADDRIRSGQPGRQDNYDRADRSSRRSRSPRIDSSSPRKHESSSKHKDRGERSPRYRESRDRDTRAKTSDSDRQITTKKDGPLPSQADSFSMVKDPGMALVRAEDKPLQEKQKPNFAPTGLLAAASNTVAKADGTSIVLKYHEPPEARKPPQKDQWKLFVFKGADIIETIELSLRSCWLVGRELAVVDLPAEHPSISKQHAVIQFRWIEKRNEFGDKLGRVKPYLIDLESANGTMLNKEPVPSSRYLELRDKDMIQFGDSTREYVLMLPPRD